MINWINKYGALLGMMIFAVGALITTVITAVTMMAMFPSAPTNFEDGSLISDDRPGMIEPIIHAEEPAVTQSASRPLLTSMAQRQAEKMARDQQQSHSLFMELSGDGWRYAEVVAESWPNQTDLPKWQLWAEAFAAWEQSEAHWSVVGKRHDYYGRGLAKGKNGIWYFCIITSDEMN